MKRYPVSSITRKIQNKISEILSGWFFKKTIPSVRMQSNTQNFRELLVKMQKNITAMSDREWGHTKKIAKK